MVCSPHFEGAEGQAAQQKDVFQLLLSYKTDFMPIPESRHLSHNLSRYRAMAQRNPCHEAYQLFSEGIF